MAQRKLNSLFKKTEPSLQEQIDNVYLNMDYGEPEIPDDDTAADPVATLEAEPAPETKTKKKKTTPRSVYISESDYEVIQDIAAAYGEKPHAVIQYAVKEVIRKWKRTKKLKTNEDGKLRK